MTACVIFDISVDIIAFTLLTKTAWLYWKLGREWWNAKEENLKTPGFCSKFYIMLMSAFICLGAIYKLVILVIVHLEEASDIKEKENTTNF